MKILFQGDSITDAGRSREDDANIGMGYPMFVKAMMDSLIPDCDIEFVNRGISGNRVCDLRARWKEDCLDIKPDILSIFIGINDVWRKFDSSDPTTAEEFERDYRFILEETNKHLPNTKIVIIEPFVLPYPEDRLAWREDLDPKIQVARKLASEFKTSYIPLDGIFAKATILATPQKWSGDGVHPTASGHALIAQKFIEELDDLL